MTLIDSFGLSDIGHKRRLNEDSYFLDNDLGIYVVADGMGGHQAGEVASRMVVETVRDYMKRFPDGKEVEELEDPDPSLSKEANRLLSSVTLANRVVHQLARSSEAYSGMGSTVSLAAFTEKTLIALNVGDSPIYLVRDGEISPLYKPHTVLAEQEAMNQGEGELLSNYFSHMLTRAIGTRESVQADLVEIAYKNNDMVIIASDGLTDKVQAREILGLAKEGKPAKICRKLLELALERGGDDNITIIAARVKKAASFPGAGLFSKLLGR